MDIISIATKLLNEHMGLSLDSTTVSSALSGLIGNGQGGIDLAGLASKMSQNGDFSSMLGSWLGDGENQSIPVDSLSQLFGQDNLSTFAGQLGVDPETATQGLSDVLPKVMDQASSGGSLVESMGGVGGLLDKAKSLFS